MHDDQSSPDDFALEPRGLRVHRIEHHGDTNIAWTTKDDLYRYLQKLHLKGKHNEQRKYR